MSITINGTTGISGVDGSSTTPAFQGNDTNTGLFYGTDIVGISTGGSERVRVDANGNVGIGTTNPSPKITVARTATTSVTNASYYLGLGGTENLVDSKRLIGMGYSSGSSEEYPTAMGYVETSNASYTNGAIAFYTRSVTTNTAPSERMRIDSSGNVLVNSTSAIRARIGQMQIKAVSTQEALTTSSNDLSYAHWAARSADAGAGTHYLGYFENSSGTNVGTITHNNTNTSYTTSSDYRLKENIVPMTGALDIVQALKPVTYKWKSDGSDGQGFIAHELQAVVPDCVIGEKDAVDEEGKPIYQGVDTSFLVATLTAAIQEQQAIINDLKARVTALETNNV